MTRREYRIRLAALVAAAAAAAGCGGAPPPLPPPAVPPPLTIAAPEEATVKAPMTITVAADANPDRNSRPSQVVVRIYQLRADAAFTSADYEPLYDQEKQVLGQELISRDEFVLQPTDTRTIDVVLAPETRFVGAMVPFRDIQNSRWRAVMAKPKGGLRVDVGRSSVTLEAVE